MLAHTPPRQRSPWAHSFTSGEKTRAAEWLKSADVIVADAVEVCRGEGADFAPSHRRPSADAANPGPQPWQAKEPALLMQIPSGHTLPVAHSSTSGKKTRIAFDKSQTRRYTRRSRSSSPGHTFTVPAVCRHLVAVVTGASVGAFQVDTAAVGTDPGEHALVHIWRKDTEGEWGRGRGSASKRQTTDFACSPFSQSVKRGPRGSCGQEATLIRATRPVATLAGVVGRELVALEAVAAVGALGVDAPTAATRRLVQTLVHV